MSILNDPKGWLIDSQKKEALRFAIWLRENCIVTRDGWRSSRNNFQDEITNEQAYEMYLESLK
jgi:hypothetical protein